MYAIRSYYAAAARAALERGRQPVVGFSCYTWNAAEFLEAARQLNVITSYSIHYTKLYEVIVPPGVQSSASVSSGVSGTFTVSP